MEVDGDCTWTGHCLGTLIPTDSMAWMMLTLCLGDVCKSDVDCDGEWGCSSGVCSISADTFSEGDEDDSESEPKKDTPYTQWSPTEPATVANPQRYTTVYVTVYPRATGVA